MSEPKVNTPPVRQPTEDQPLPQFRKDLKVLPGPDEPDGSPTFNLYDPVRARYYRLAWYEAAIFELLEPGMTIKQLAARLSKKTSMGVTVRDLEMFFYDAKVHNLLDLPHSSEELYKEVKSKEVNPFTWALFHYLYFRIPLVYPDAFLERTLRYVVPLGSKLAFICYFIIIASGFLMLMHRFDEFLHTFTYFFNLQGIVVYSLAIFGIKILHELGHAYTAKYFGLHVPVMGIAVIVLWPVLYTDASDVWKLKSRQQRFAISAAGIIVELVLAGFATWGWILSDPGIAQSVFFLLASVTWISSLLINLNPCMRFDGYYLLSDVWGIDNLQTRAFAVARWKIREWLLDLKLPPPEVVSNRRLIGMLVYSVITWVYRISLYIGIAIIIYFKFTKVLGVLLFLLEVGVFLIWPFVSEVQDLIKLKDKVKINRRAMITSVVVILAFFWFVLPMPQTFTFPAIIVPVESQGVRIPYKGVIKKIFVKRGDVVTVGQPLIEITSPDLANEVKAIHADIAVTEREILNATFNEKERSNIASKQAELRTLQSRLEGLLNQKSDMTVRADLNGTVYEWEEQVTEGQSIKQDFLIGRIAPLGTVKALAYVPEDEIGELSLGQEIEFVDTRSLSKFPGIVEQIRTGRDIILDYRQLASVYGGALPAKEETGTDGKLHLVESYYVVDVKFEDPSTKLAIGQLGNIKVSGRWHSRVMHIFRLFEKIVYRESGT